ncbi:hypothetical protein WR25_03934 isoform C [Diploscapter pachys]|uniref:Uncharacterized protein n=1 Tax=Diploscapter pachys TaxID=2018661 RepID=A0A2A2J1N9_9BILA|nr:hypothetical protein WR25_03934 isoform A [Diploscapter pachys]PAV55535.1 hypothetical protein WR25_03934 isoform B [Diploscapter pachys]PAV55536.1 hypothetical protein WR25_03934 isoform C [Diploscapter pachys]
MKSSFAGLFEENSEDRFPPQLLGVSIAQAVDCGLTGTDRLGLKGSVRASNGRGDGHVAAIWKKNIGGVALENTLTVSSDNVQVSTRIARSIFTRSAVILQPALQYSYQQEAFVPSLSFIFSMRLRMRWQGSLMWHVTPMNSAFTTTLVHTEYNQPKALSPTNSNIRLVYYVREPAKDAFTECAVQISLYGIAPSINFERRLSRFSRVGASLHFTFPACILSAKLKLKTGQSVFEWHIVLCDDRENLTRSFVYGVALPIFAVQAAKVLFRPWWEKAALIFEDNKRDLQADLARQEEAGKVIHLMRPTAERIKREEEQRRGVIILEAKYGQCEQSGSRAYPMAGERTIDVTIPLQAMVHDSQLRIYSVKSQLPGFYDPCPNEPKMLQIRYLFREELHAVTVGDEMPVTLPLRG